MLAATVLTNHLGIINASVSLEKVLVEPLEKTDFAIAWDQHQTCAVFPPEHFCLTLSSGKFHWESFHFRKGLQSAGLPRPRRLISSMKSHAKT
eukprot:597530-Pelagomonas_calceolata.AAC.10